MSLRLIPAACFRQQTVPARQSRATGRAAVCKRWAVLRSEGPSQIRCLLLARPALRADSQQLTVAERLPYPTPAPRLDFVELPERLTYVLLALSTGSEGVVRLVELRA